MRINDEGEESNNTDLDKVRTRGMWDSTSDARENPTEHGQVTMEHEISHEPKEEEIRERTNFHSSGFPHIK